MEDAWTPLRKVTSARIALGRSGGSLPTAPRLQFQLAHARARDAVLSPFDAADFARTLAALSHPILPAHSAARDRAEYLRRPDLGRRLSDESREILSTHAANLTPVDLLIVISDGLSTHAVATQAQPLLSALLPLISASQWTLAPIITVRHGRVAIQDEIGALFRATISLMLLGERPGLGAADSLGAYFTFHPAPGNTDANRNCISNIRPGGISPPAAAAKLHPLISQSFHLALSGVQLKDDTLPLPTSPQHLSLP
jgi:ethanolamine ammonia-lyase small subunit